IFIGDQDSFDPFLLDLRAVHDQVCVGVAETFFADDDPIYTQVFHELGRKIAGPLLVKQGHVLVGNYAAHKAEVCAVALQQVVNDRVVQVVVGCVLVTGGNTVAADNGPVHHFRWLHEGGHHVFHVDAVVIGVVEQALALQHVDVGDLGQIWIAPVVFVQGQKLVGGGLIWRQGARRFPEVVGGPQAHLPARRFMLVGSDPGNRLRHNNQVMQLGKGGQLGAWSLHIDDALLVAHDPACGDHAHALEHMGAAYTCWKHLAHQSGED